MPNVTLNPDTGNIEIRYGHKPADATRATLSQAGFHFHGPTQAWWGVPTAERLALAVKVDPDFRPVKTARGKTLKPMPVKANGMAEDFNRVVPRVMKADDYVQFTPSNPREAPLRGYVRTLNRTARGVTVRLDSPVIITRGGQSVGSDELRQRALNSWEGSFQVLDPKVGVRIHGKNASDAPKSNGAAKANGNLGEELAAKRRFNVALWDNEGGRWKHYGTLTGASAGAVSRAFRAKWSLDTTVVKVTPVSQAAPPSRRH